MIISITFSREEDKHYQLLLFNKLYIIEYTLEMFVDIFDFQVSIDMHIRWLLTLLPVWTCNCSYE